MADFETCASALSTPPGSPVCCNARIRREGRPRFARRPVELFLVTDHCHLRVQMAKLAKPQGSR
jgi:hypothetical protein